MARWLIFSGVGCEWIISWMGGKVVDMLDRWVGGCVCARVGGWVFG